MAKVKSFRELEVWQLAMQVVVDCYGLTQRFPQNELYGLTAQVRRATVSVPSNIAEGHNRHTRRAFLNHVNLALGSLAELETQLEIGVRVRYLTRQQVCEVSEKAARVGQMLRRLQQSLESDLQTRGVQALLVALASAL
jgi:four helix bundle protein